MKSSASESLRNAYFNLERLSRSSRLARPRISTVERLWNGFGRRLCKQFDENEHFSPFELSSAGIKIGVWINSGGLNSFGRP